MDRTDRSNYAFDTGILCSSINTLDNVFEGQHAKQWRWLRLGERQFQVELINKFGQRTCISNMSRMPYYIHRGHHC